ncbi:FliM/FliN family flagellar motor switch protein [Hyphomicrobium methylovorum]|uniref:FliM/FliN family flagellar motor switch protein n=1 Tax=Hyphomicrobium methylovorum TaxID=84 RepID=UPI0031B5A425
MHSDRPARTAVAQKTLERALSAGHNRPDRLPGLQMIFGQLPRILVEDISAIALQPVKVQLLDLGPSTLGEMCTLSPGTLAAVVRTERWRSWLYFMADPVATTLFVEAASGAEALPPSGFLPRKPTKTDANIMRVFFRRLARCLSSAFSLLVDVNFEVRSVVDEIEMEPNLSTSSTVIVARLGIEFPGHMAIINIVIPQAAFEPVRDVLSAPVQNDPAGSPMPQQKSRGDSEWSKQLSEEIARSFIDLNGVLEERTISLGEVQKFAVGSIVELTSTTLSRVRLDADEIPLFWCDLGKRDKALILRVEDDFDKSREGIDEFYGL